MLIYDDSNDYLFGFYALFSGIHHSVSATLEKITFTVREAGVSRNNVVPIKGPFYTT